MTPPVINPVLKEGRCAIFLDRDGTLNIPIIRNKRPFPPTSVAEFQLLPGVREGCKALADAGYVLVVVTNQPDVGRGSQTKLTVEEINCKLQQLIPQIAHVEVCYDSGQGESPSEFRKPAPGMLFRAARRFNLDLTRSWMIGDRWRDIDCGVAAGCRTIFLDWGYHEELKQKPNFMVRSFPEAVHIVTSDHKNKPNPK